ncbi:MAG: 30S ribosome-binding factor RbfA [Actinomycetota bacterium]
MSERMERVNEEVREILAVEVQRLKDPRLGFVTVTAVRVTPDLRMARVFYTVLGEERDHKATRAALRSARSRLRAVLGRQIRTKVTPELEFQEDVAADRGHRIEEIIAGLHDRGELRDDGATEESG